MATSGQCATNYNDDSRQAVDWQRASYNLNVYPPTSTINWQLWLNLGHNYYSNAIKNYGVNINGGSVYGGNTWSNYNKGSYQVANGSVTITHNNDGNKTFNINTSGWFYDSYSVSGSQDFALDRLYSGATTNSVTGDKIGEAFKIKYTTHGGSYTYKLRVSIPNVAALERVDYGTSEAEYYLSQSAIDELIRRYPNNTSFSLGFAVESYSGGTKVADGNEKIITVTIAPPVLSNPNVDSRTRTTITFSYDLASGVAPTSQGCEVYDENDALVKTVEGTSPITIDSLSANTNYKIRAFATNKGGTSYSDYIETITTGNSPNVTAYSPFIQVGYTVFNFTVTYDTNAEYKSIRIDYGHTPDYGSYSLISQIPTEDNNSPYYFKATITDNFDRTGTIAGVITSGGNAPIINVTNDYVKANKASYTFTPTYDTNAHFSSMIVQYFYEGESEQHNINYDTEPSNILLTNLKPNKYYTLKVRLTDNFNKTTIGEVYFKTPSGMRINGYIATELKLNGKVISGMKLNGKILYE